MSWIDIEAEVTAPVSDIVVSCIKPMGSEEFKLGVTLTETALTRLAVERGDRLTVREGRGDHFGKLMLVKAAPGKGWKVLNVAHSSKGRVVVPTKLYNARFHPLPVAFEWQGDRGCIVLDLPKGGVIKAETSVPVLDQVEPVDEPVKAAVPEPEVPETETEPEIVEATVFTVPVRALDRLSRREVALWNRLRMGRVETVVSLRTVGGPEITEGSVHVALSNLRRALRPLGLRVHHAEGDVQILQGEVDASIAEPDAPATVSDASQEAEPEQDTVVDYPAENVAFTVPYMVRKRWDGVLTKIWKAMRHGDLVSIGDVKRCKSPPMTAWGVAAQITHLRSAIKPHGLLIEKDGEAYRMVADDA